MSHYTVGVIFQPTPGWSVEQEVERALAPYDERRLVPPYDAPCGCVGRRAREAAAALVDERCGSVEALRAQRAAQEGVVPEAELSTWWEQQWEVRVALQERWARLHPARAEPNSICGFNTESYCEEGGQVGERFKDGSGCGGTGSERTQGNDHGYWDWYEIGGRWDGDLYADGETAEDLNVRPVRALLARVPLYLPLALVLPTGEWVAKARMGWWACTSDELPPAWWEAEFRRHYEAHADCLLCLVDAHC